MKRISLALALALWSSYAMAQWQVPAGSIPIGRGEPTQGFTSVAPSSNGNCLVVTGLAWTSGSCSSSFGAGVGTWLTTPSSANLRGALTDETGTGLAYFQGGDIGTPSAGVGTNLTALNASNLASGTIPAARLPLTNTSFSVASVTAASNNSASALMAGAGVTNCKLTPTYSSRVRVQFDTSVSNAGAAIGMTLSLRFGTGTAPGSNAAATGTIISGPFVYTADAGGTRPATMSAVITGLTPGTAYWFDFALTSNGTATLTPTYGCNGFEF